MELHIDRTIYSDACIAKTVYALSKDYIISRNTVDKNIETLNVLSIDSNIDDETIRGVILSSLNDYKLRQIIEDETHDIRTILYAKAFAEFDDIDEEYV